jgi:predicted PurR-regulated permease PerM
MENKYSIEISWQTLWRVFVFGLAVYIFVVARQAIGALFLAMVIAFGFDPIVGFFERHKLGRLLGTVVVFLGGGLLLSGVLFLLVPPVIGEMVGLVADFNTALSSTFGLQLPPTLVAGVSQSLSRVLGFLGASNVSITGTVSTVFSNVLLALGVLIASFYLSIEQKGPERLLRVILPDMYEKTVLTVFRRFQTKVRRWLGTQLALSLFIGVIVSLGLWILGVRYPLALGLVAALFEVVPIIGPILAGAAAFVVASGDGFSVGLYVILFFIIVQQIENNVLIPVIMGRTMKVHPVIVLVSLLAGAGVAGFFGILLAVPVAVLAQEIFNYMAEQKSRRPAKLV